MWCACSCKDPRNKQRKFENECKEMMIHAFHMIECKKKMMYSFQKMMYKWYGGRYTSITEKMLVYTRT